MLLRGTHNITSRCYFISNIVQNPKVMVDENTKVPIAPKRAVLRRYPAPISMTKWRMPDARCWNTHQDNPNRMYVPNQLVAKAVKRSYASAPSEIDHNHQSSKGIPTSDIAMADKRCMIDVIIAIGGR